MSADADKKLKDAAHAANLPELLNLPPIGELTKLELLHFVLYHTQRHIQQLKNILQKKKQKKKEDTRRGRKKKKGERAIFPPCHTM